MASNWSESSRINFECIRGNILINFAPMKLYGVIAIVVETDTEGNIRNVDNRRILSITEEFPITCFSIYRQNMLILIIPITFESIKY